MAAVMVIAARWIVSRMALPPRPLPRLAMGGIALALILATEFTMVLRLRNLSFEKYVATLDALTGTAYYAMLAVFAVIPLFVPPPVLRFKAWRC